GLTLVRRLVELHGGTVAVHSAGPGQGTEFTIRLPCLGTPVTPAEHVRSDEAPPTIASQRVLVVDDNRDAAESLAMLLRLEGQHVQVAFDGHTALAMAREFRPQTVFLDIGMPGMDGYEVAKRLRQDPGLKDTVLVAVTGWGQQEDRRQSQAAGFD